MIHIQTAFILLILLLGLGCKPNETSDLSQITTGTGTGTGSGSSSDTLLPLPVDGALQGLTGAQFSNFANAAVTNVIATDINLTFSTSMIGEYIYLYSDKYCINQIQKASIGLAGTATFSLNYANDGSGDGKHNYYFRDGNSSVPNKDCASTGLFFTLDTSPPISLVSHLHIVGIENNGFSPNTQPVITGTYLSTEKDTVVNLYTDNTCSALLTSGTVQADGSLNLSGITFTAGTDDGYKDFYVKLTDAAGNIQTCNKLYLSYTLDTIAPNAPTGTYSLNYTLSYSPATSNSTSPTITWSTANYNEGDTVLAYTNTTCSGTPIETALPWPKPGSTSFPAASFLPNGTEDGLKSFSLRLKDRAGNISVCTDTTESYTLDTIPPIVTFDLTSIPVGTVTTPFIIRANISEVIQLTFATGVNGSTTGSSSFTQGPPSLFDWMYNRYISLNNGRAWTQLQGQYLQIYIEPESTGDVTFSLKSAVRDLTGNYNLPSGSITVNYVKPVYFEFESSSSTISEKSGTANLKIKASEALPENATISYEILSSSTAAFGNHYNLSSGSILMNQGTSEAILPIPVLDSLDPVNRHLVLAIKSVSTSTAKRFAIGRNSLHRLIIEDDETKPFEFSKIGSGENYICGLRTNGKLNCWGKNNLGQLGDTTNTDRNAPVLISGATNFIDLAVGLNSNCAIDDQNDLYCWGENNYYQVADTATASYNSLQLRDSAFKYKKIHTSGTTYCGITTSDQIRCWGYGSQGITGTGSTTASQSPTTIDSSTTYKSISISSTTACGITTSDSRKCWGKNVNYSLNQANNNSSYLVPTFLSNSDSTGLKKIATKDNYTCIIDSTDKIQCWGQATDQRIGIIENKNYITLKYSVDANNRFKDLILNKTGGCGITTSGLLRCWGSTNYQSQGFLSNYETTPVTVEPDQTFTEFTASGVFSCAKNIQGKNICWGIDLINKTDGDYISYDQSNIVKLPTHVASGANANLNLGSRSGCYTQSNGDLYCWGTQRGLLNTDFPTVTPSKTNTLMGVSYLTLDKNPQSYDSGLLGCSISVSQDLFCWGKDGGYGALGVGPFSVAALGLRFWPAQIDIGTKYQKVSVGKVHACGLTTGSKVKCWGQSSSGQIGTGVISGNSNTVPNIVDSSTNYIDIAVNFSHSCGITDSNKLKCWGLIYGNTPVAVDAATNYSKIFPGDNHFCGITTSNKLRCWGSNTYGQIGAAGASDTVAVDVDNASDYMTMALGDSHTCGITSGNQLKCWGLNSNGQVGDGTTTNVSTPTVIDPGVNYKNVATGNFSTCGITSGDDLKCWGRRNFGEIGDGFNNHLPRIYDK